MNVTTRPLDAQPLVAALRALDAAYHDAIRGADDLIAALASGNFGQVQIAVAAQDATLRAIESLERRRRTIQSELESLIDDGTAPATSEDTAASYSCSALLKVLPPDEAGRLRAARHDLLLTLRELQSKNGVAAMMLQNAQAVMKRLLRAQEPATLGYGPRGEPALAGQPAPRRQVRWA
jgi:hypothetical protein